MALPPINIVLKATTDGFKRGVSVVDGQLDKIENSANSLQRRLATTGDRLTMVGRRMSIITGAASGAAAGLLALAVGAAHAGDAIGDGAKAAGLSTTAFQEYRFAIKEAADMTDDEFAGAMVKLNKTLGDARDGSKSAVAAFEAIGVSQAQIADGSFDSEAALKAFVKTMEETKDPATAAAVAADLFGKAGARIGAGLSGVPGQVAGLVQEARNLGVVLGPDTIKVAGEVDAKIKALGAQFEATKVKIGATLLPFLNDTLLPFLSGTLIPGIGDVIEKVIGWGTAFSELPGPVQTALELVAVAIGAGGPVLLAVGVMSKVLAALISTGPLGAFMLIATTGAAAWAIWGEDIKKAVGAAIDYISGKFNEILAFFDRMIEGAKKVGTALAEMLGIDANVRGAMAGGFSSDGAQNDTAAGAFNTNQIGGTGGSNSSSTGANIANGTINGFVATMDARAPDVTAAMDRMTQTARNAVGVQSPSTVFAEIGKFIGEGLSNGIAQSQGIVNAAVSTMGQGAVGATNGMVSDILSGLDTLFAGSQKVGAAIALVNMFIGMSQEIKKGTFGFAAAAKVAAQGYAIIKGIKGAKSGSGGGGGVGSGGGRGGGGGSGAEVQQPTQNLNVSFLSDPFGIGESVARQLAGKVNEAQRNGARLNVTVR